MYEMISRCFKYVSEKNNKYPFPLIIHYKQYFACIYFHLRKVKHTVNILIYKSFGPFEN